MLAALLGIAIGVTSPGSLTGHAGAAVGDRVFVCGGMGMANEGHYFKESWMVDPSTGTWSPLPPAKMARGMAAAVEFGAAVYVAGGLAWSDEALATVEKFDLKTKKWSEVAPLHIPRSRLSLVAVGGKIYAVSGMKGDSRGHEPINTPTIEQYDPVRNSWREAGRLKHARHGFAATVWHGRIYVFGGNDEETRQNAEVWDPETGTSEELPPMPVLRGFEGVVLHGGKMILFGGRSIGDHPSAFDPIARQWSALPIADIDLCRFASVQVGNTLWTVGGESLGGYRMIHSFDLNMWN